MLGKTVLFLPGFDHAGIATQSVVEKRLYKFEKQTRHDLGREKFLEKVMHWKDECVKSNLSIQPPYDDPGCLGTRSALRISSSDLEVATIGVGLLLL